MRHEYDIQGNYGLQDYNYTVSNNLHLDFLFLSLLTFVLDTLVLWAVEFYNINRSDTLQAKDFKIGGIVRCTETTRSF